MIVVLTTITILNGKETEVKENINNNDLRLEMLKDINGCFNSWNILDYIFDYKCGQTKHGYRVVKTIRQHKETKETVIQNFQYN